MRRIVAVMCPRCEGIADRVLALPGEAWYFECGECLRIFEKYDVDYDEVDTDSGELHEWRHVDLAREALAVKVLAYVATADEFEICPGCSARVWLRPLGEHGVQVLDGDGTVHARHCCGMFHRVFALMGKGVVSSAAALEQGVLPWV